LETARGFTMRKRMVILVFATTVLFGGVGISTTGCGLPTGSQEDCDSLHLRNDDTTLWGDCCGNTELVGEDQTSESHYCMDFDGCEEAWEVTVERDEEGRIMFYEAIAGRVFKETCTGP
jgi:hypothetical protein